jgi:hypothetical protein
MPTKSTADCDTPNAGASATIPTGQNHRSPQPRRIRRRALLLTAIASTTMATILPLAASSSSAAAAAPSVAAAASSAFLPYSADSYFKSTVTGAPIDQALTDSFHTFMATNAAQKGTPYPLIRGVGGNHWGTVYAEGQATDPVWKLTGTVPSAVSQLKTVGFHAPESLGSQLTGTSDSPFVVMDRGSGISVWGAKASVVGTHLITVGAAGFFQHASNGLDRRDPLSNSTTSYRSRGAIPDSMVIRKDVMTQAIATGSDLGYVLHMFMVETNSAAGFVHPMVGAESGQSGWGAEGTRLAVKPTAVLTGCSPTAKVIALTLQRHGAYIGDNAGSQSSFKAEQDNAAKSIWGTSLTSDSLKGCVSWSDFQVVKAGWK